MCLYPTLIKNPKYKKNKKNNGIIPPIQDERVIWVPIGCNKCIECKKQKAMHWQTRLQEEIKTNKYAKFTTLTFSNHHYTEIHNKIHKQAEGYDRDNAIAKYAVRHFLERYRKKHNKSLQHWFTTELGHKGTNNIHLHGILWHEQFKTMEWLEKLNEIEEIWNYGHIWKYQQTKREKLNYVNNKTINYLIKYVNKIDKDHPGYNSIILTSPGIGNNYTNTLNAKKNKYNNNKTKETYTTNTGHETNLPIYYRNKIYTDEEKEKLWLQKLDQQTRYVLGNKIDISKNEKQYNKAIQHARKINHDNGYGTNETTYEQEQYERNMRIIQQQTRIKNTQEKISRNRIENMKYNAATANKNERPETKTSTVIKKYCKIQKK